MGVDPPFLLPLTPPSRAPGLSNYVLSRPPQSIMGRFGSGKLKRDALLQIKGAVRNKLNFLLNVLSKLLICSDPSSGLSILQS